MNRNATEETAPLRVVIVGGGYTGVAFAIHLIAHSTGALEIGVVEPAATLGRGIAYGTHDPVHRINVPLGRMSLYRQDPDHATRWMVSRGVLPDAACTDERGHDYVARGHYGDYVADTLQRAIADAGGRVVLKHHRSRATSIESVPSACGPAHSVQLGSGTALAADIVVLAFGHAVPVLPCAVEPDALADARLITDPWQAGALDAIALTDSVLLVGTGLTMADVLASLLARGHRAPITAISRRGLLPKQHGEFGTIDFLQGEAAPITARALLRLAHRRIAQYRERDWHPVLDGLRAQLQEIWPALPAAQQRRVVRRLLPFWEVHRFRIGPQVQASLEQAIAAGTLAVLRAGIASIGLAHGQLQCRLRPIGESPRCQGFDRIIFCTGPDKNIASNPLIAALLARGTVRLDAIGAGLAVDPGSRILDATGQVVEGLFAFGPITRGTFGEMTGAPDIAEHIELWMRRFGSTIGIDPTCTGTTRNHLAI